MYNNCSYVPIYTCIGTTVLATPNMKVCNKYIIKSQNKFLFCSSIQFDIEERIKLRCLRTGYLGIFIFYENYDRFCHIFIVFICALLNGLTFACSLKLKIYFWNSDLELLMFFTLPQLPLRYHSQAVYNK